MSSRLRLSIHRGDDWQHWLRFTAYGGRVVFDAVITATSAVVTSSTADFSSDDIGVKIFGPGIAAGTTVLSVNGPSATLSAAATTTTSSGAVLTIRALDLSSYAFAATTTVAEPITLSTANAAGGEILLSMTDTETTNLRASGTWALAATLNAITTTWLSGPVKVTTVGVGGTDVTHVEFAEEATTIIASQTIPATTGGGGGGGGVTDHGALTGLSDPDHPIAAVVGLQAAIDGKAPTVHVHSGADITTGTVAEARIDSTIARDAEVVLQSLVDAKADLLVGIADNTVARLPVGANNHVLTADSALTAGVKWAAAAGGVTYAGGPLFIAASDAPAAEVASANFVCSGTDDHVTINTAIAASLIASAPTNRYGSVVLSAGRFSMRGAILIPSRGFSIRGQGFRTELYAAVGSGTFSATGEGSEQALIMLAETAAARNACEVSISDMFFNCTDGSGISGIWFDQSAGGSTNIGSEATYGTPTCADNGDTYHSFSRLRMRAVKHGIGFVGGAGTNTRGNNVSDVRINGVGSGGVAGYGYYTDAASDCHFNQCHVIIDNVVGSTGFYMGGGNSRLTGCKAAYFDGAGSIGFDIASSRNSLDAIEAQDCYTGIRISGIDCRITGARVETQVSPCLSAVYITGDNSHITGLYIHRRGTGTYENGLYYNDTSDDRVCEAFIDPAGFTNPLRVGADTSVTLADLGVGKYSIRTLGVGNLVSAPISGHTLKDAGVVETQRAGMNFLDGFILTDDAANDETEVLIDFGTSATQIAQGDHAHAATYQPLDADLTTIAALTPTNGNAIVGNGTAWTSGTVVAADPPTVAIISRQNYK